MHKKFIYQFLKTHDIDYQIFYIIGQDDILKITGKYQYIKFEIDISLINALSADNDYIEFNTKYGKISIPRKKKNPKPEQKPKQKIFDKFKFRFKKMIGG